MDKPVLHVCIGPTLDPCSVQRQWPVVVHPPAQCMSLARLVLDHGARRILLVDGVFEHSPSVWHREILWCLAQGCAMYGCSSMGALRAAETARYGMIGLGEVYLAYCRATERMSPFEAPDAELHQLRACLPTNLCVSDTTIAWLYEVTVAQVFNHDDDVALLHAPADQNHIACGFALCDLVFRVRQSSLPRWVTLTVLAVAKELSFKHRTYETLSDCLDAYLPLEWSEALKSCLTDPEVIDQKASDAAYALDVLQQKDLVPNSYEKWGFEPTRYWERTIHMRADPDFQWGSPALIKASQ